MHLNLGMHFPSGHLSTIELSLYIFANLRPKLVYVNLKFVFLLNIDLCELAHFENVSSCCGTYLSKIKN
jgi:hypothetical protein